MLIHRQPNKVVFGFTTCKSITIMTLDAPLLCCGACFHACKRPEPPFSIGTRLIQRQRTKALQLPCCKLNQWATVSACIDILIQSSYSQEVALHLWTFLRGRSILFERPLSSCLEEGSDMIRAQIDYEYIHPTFSTSWQVSTSTPATIRAAALCL